MATPSARIQPEEKRTKNFNEVSLGYNKKLAVDEARRCAQYMDHLNIDACPINVNIPGFIRYLSENNPTEAYTEIRQENPLPSVCGRICSAICEKAYKHIDEGGPINIRALERYAADAARHSSSRKPNKLRGKKLAIIGSGPSGLAAAHDLVRKGYQVTIYESLDKPGGVLRYGIPEFRLPNKVLDVDINEIKALGVQIETNCFIGQTTSLDDLFDEGHNAILLAMGAGIPKFMDIKGANLGGVYYGEEFLMRVNISRPNMFSRHVPNFIMGQKVVVIGSGNTALDCARAAARFDRDVRLIFRRTEDEMRVRGDERSFGKAEGVQFEPLVRPLEVLSDQNEFVAGLKCVRMDYAATDQPDEWDLVEVPKSEFIMDVDTIIIAIGHKPNSYLHRISPQLKVNQDGTIQIDDESGMTSLHGVFACGNVVTNAGPVVEAIAAGKRAAEQIHEYLVK